MKVCLLACFALTLGCGSHVTPVAELGVPDAGAGDAGEDASREPACMASYELTAEGSTSRYKMGAERAMWIDAARDCEADGAHLIVIDDAAENDWLSTIAETVITDEMSSHQLLWLGLGDSRSEGTFRWVAEREGDLMPWAADEPNSLYGDEDCVEIRAGGEWNDDRCDAELAYVCECDGIASANAYCDTAADATCGDCDTACAADQSCVNQLCE